TRQTIMQERIGKGLAACGRMSTTTNGVVQRNCGIKTCGECREHMLSQPNPLPSSFWDSDPSLDHCTNVSNEEPGATKDTGKASSPQLAPCGNPFGNSAFGAR